MINLPTHLNVSQKQALSITKLIKKYFKKFK